MLSFLQPMFRISSFRSTVHPKALVRLMQYAGSKEVMVCNDNKIDRLFYSKSGMAPNCGEFSYWTKRGNYDVQRKGVSCQKPDGTWEIVNTTQW